MLALAWALQTASPSSKCDGYADQVVAAAPDTTSARAVEFAGRLNRECRNDFEALFRAGRALNRVARFEQVKAHRDLREQTRRLLSRAAVLRQKNAAAWLEYGLLLRKQGGLQIDAQRAIKRALELAEQFPDSTPPNYLAEMNFQRARNLEQWVDRLRNLKDGSRLGVTTPSCSALGAFCENFVHPAQFNGQLKDAAAVDFGLQARREQMLGWFESVVRLDPAHEQAAERYARELALGGEWERLATAAHQVAGRGIEPAYFTAIQGLALSRVGRVAEADSVFRDVVPRLSEPLRRWFEQPPPGLDSIPDFWRRGRPLWLAPFNELELEHWTRVTYAFLVFSDREAEIAGPETPMGDALLRYGWPAMVTQVERDASKVLSAAQLDAAAGFLACTPGDVQGPGGDAGGFSCDPSGAITTDFSKGHWLFWTYAMDRPSVIFEVRPGMRAARYMRESVAEDYAKQLRATTPITFHSTIAPKTFQLPVQAARFKGGGPAETVLALYGLVPTREMELPPSDSVRVGLFLFRDSSGFPLSGEQVSRHASGPALPLNYRVPLVPGRYSYSLEAFAPERGTAARARAAVIAPVWNPDSLELSDLVIAHRVDPRSVGEPLTWRDLTIEASRTLEVTKGTSVWVMWEVYGLKPGSEGTGKYQVSMALRDAKGAVPVRALAGLGKGERPRGAAVALEWTSERRLSPDGRALDYVALELPSDAVGEYELTMTVSDGARHATTTRGITVSRP